MIILFVAIFATLTEADYDKSKPVSCNNWKKMDEPCPGCVLKQETWKENVKEQDNISILPNVRLQEAYGVS